MQGEARTTGEPRELRNIVRRSLRRALDGRGKVALLDYPSFLNPGDHAIWLGSRRLLASLDGVSVVYTASSASYRREHLRRAIGPQGTILLTGGGNFGDLYPHHERFRRRVISDFPRHRILQLPQSIHYRNPVTLRRSREVFSRHRRLRILARDRRSLRLAREELGCEADLCPDLAFALEPTAEVVTRDTVPVGRPFDVLWLRRSDSEARAQDVQALSLADELREARRTTVRRCDWKDGLPKDLGLYLSALRWVPASSGKPARELSARARDFLSRSMVGAATSVLDSTRVVVTDRLHGCILGVLLGKDCFLFDNSYGKNSAFMRAWKPYLEQKTRLFQHESAAVRSALEFARRS